MRMIVLLSFIFNILAVEATAQAETPLLLANFPPRLTMPTGVTQEHQGKKYQCFAPSEYQTLIRISLAYERLYDWRLSAMGVLRAHHAATASRDNIIFEMGETIVTLKENRDWLTLRLAQTTKFNQETTTSMQYEKIALWGVILVETIFIGVLGATSIGN